MDSIPLLIFIGVFIGLVKGGITGPIGGAVILPLLSQVMTVPEAAGLMLPLLIIGDIFALRFYWREWDWKLVRLLLPAAIVGIAVGLRLLFSLPDDTLRHILGVITLIIIAYKLGSDLLKSLEYQHRIWHGLLTGFVAGAMSALANVGGPPVNAYLLLQKLEPKTFVGTMTLFFFIVNLIKVPPYVANGIIDVPLLLSIAWIIPLIPLGVWIGRRIIGRINRLWFERAMIVLLIWASLRLLFG